MTELTQAMNESLMVLVRDEEGNLLARRSNMNGTLWKLENDTFFNIDPIEIGPAEREGKPVTLHCVSHSGRVFIGGPLSIAGRFNITRLMVGYKLRIPAGMIRIQWYTAAAEVGETALEKENRLMNATIASSAIEIFELQKRLAATIERCAQVALAFKVNTDDPRTAQEQLAADIRALKDKP